jgi:hypothetical protein
MSRSAQDEEPQASSEEEVEEIQWHPRDGHEHIYVWRQRGDHLAGHEEIAEVEEVDRVEQAAKRLVSLKVIVTNIALLWKHMYVYA